MKPLKRLTNVQKATLLHELFPGEIPGFITFAAELCEHIIKQGDELADNWDNPFITVGYWLSLASTSGARIKAKKHSLINSSKVFADQLFDGLDALLLVHCLQQYTKPEREHTDCKFPLAVDLLFNP